MQPDELRTLILNYFEGFAHPNRIQLIDMAKHAKDLPSSPLIDRFLRHCAELGIREGKVS